MIRQITYTFILFASFVVNADCESLLDNNIGWTIISSKTIDGYKNSIGKKVDSFEGCEHGRVIYFRVKKSVTCNSYGYQKLIWTPIATNH